MQIDWGLIVILLCIGVPVLVVFGLYFRSDRDGRNDDSQDTHFLGTQMDLAILIAGIVLLLALLGWINETFFG